MNRQFDTKDTGPEYCQLHVFTRASRRFYGDNLESTASITPPLARPRALWGRRTLARGRKAHPYLLCASSR